MIIMNEDNEEEE